ncbi:MAG: DUF2249 domain-containing protein [Gemmatimonadota bacterium]
MPGTGTEAYEAMLAHHRILGEQLNERVSAIAAAAAAGQPHEMAVAGLVAYLAREVLPHAAAEEETIYPAAGALDGLAGTVKEMIAEHRILSEAAGRLAGAAGAAEAAERGEGIARLFAGHVAKENDILLPALLASESADLAGLLAGMHARTEQAAQAAAADADAEPAADPQATVLSLLLQATTELARAGQADRACRLTAAAWAALRESRPDLAVRLTATLHGLARRAGGAPATAGHAHSGPGEGTTPGAAAAGPDLDVRSLPPAQRHESIFAAYRALAPGSGFLLINDHDPKPLRYQFEAEHAGEFTWDYLEQGPRTWRVRIGRPAATPSRDDRAGDAAVSADHGGQEPGLDVRQLPHWQRHDTIFTAYRALRPGRGLVLINDHDPLPLRYQFDAQHAGEFTWDYLEAGPELWRVRIGRATG